MRSTPLLLLLTSLPLLLFSQIKGQITWTDSFLSAEDQVPTDGLSFGYLTVPENYDQPEGKKINIAFVVMEAANPTKAKDASMFFMGGWGQRTIRSIPYYRQHFLSQDRDLILYDYRGTGYSEPRLCEGLGEKVFENVLADRSYADFQQVQEELFDDCLDEMESQGIDFQQYGTDTKARDGVLLAEALGYESYNLFGVSYGTKTILQFLRQATVPIRSVILDSNCPLDYPINAGMTADYARSLDHIISDCESDPDCQKKYPELREEFEAFLNSLDEKPLKLGLPKGRKAYLNRQEVNGIIHQLLYSEQLYGVMPFVLKKFYVRRKFVLKRIVASLEGAVIGNYNGAGLIGYVYDHKAFLSEAQEVASQSLRDFPVYHVFDGYQAYYFQDDRFAFDTSTVKPAYTDVPALIMAGNYDPITPVSYSQRLLPYFSNAHFVVFPKTGHGVTDNFCGKEMAVRFLKDLQDPMECDCWEAVKERPIWFNR